MCTYLDIWMCIDSRTSANHLSKSMLTWGGGWFILILSGFLGDPQRGRGRRPLLDHRSNMYINIDVAKYTHVVSTTIESRFNV